MLSVPVLRRALILLTVSMLTVYAVMTYQLRAQLSAGYSDFISAYTAAKILQIGSAERLYDLDLQYQIQQQIAPHANIREGALPFVRPAFEAWLFRPLAQFPYQTAFAIWDVVSLAMLLAALLMLRREIPAAHRLSLPLVFIAALSFFPVFLTLLQGQDSILLLLIYTFTYASLRRNRDWLAGAILALATFKFTLVIPFLLTLVLQQRRRFLAGFLGCCAGLTLISAATIGWEGLRHYVSYLANIDRLAAGVNVPRDMPNLRGLLAVFSESLVSSVMGKALIVVASVALIAWTAVKCARYNSEPSQSLALSFSLNLVTTALVSYHDHVFDLALLIIPIFIVAEAVLSYGMSFRARQRLLWSVGLVAFSPLYLVLSFTVRAAGLLSVFLLMFALAMGRAMTEHSSQALSSEDAVA